MRSSENLPPQHRVSASALDREDARNLIEELEDRGVPSTAIELDEPGKTRPQRQAGPVFGDVLRSSLLAAAIGAGVGAVATVLLSAAADIEVGWWTIAGAVFGAFVGVAFGGMRVVRYASPAWRDTGDAEQPDQVTVTVEHPEREVVDTAAQVIESHGGRPKRA